MILLIGLLDECTAPGRTAWEPTRQQSVAAGGGF
jgi:hypothetical protein